MTDLDRGAREGFKFGAKLVRGAYMQLERQRALERGYPSPIMDTADDTHANYDRWVLCVWLLLCGLAAAMLHYMSLLTNVVDHASYHRMLHIDVWRSCSTMSKHTVQSS